MTALKNNSLIWILAGVMFIALSSCTSDPAEQDCNYTSEVIGEITMVTPRACDITIDVEGGPQIVKSFSPVFGNNPSPNPVPVEYAFLVREGVDGNGGLSKNILLNFMGGGACWAGTNCLDSKTNYVYDDIKDVLSNPALFGAAVQGIVSDANENNPFKDWTLVFLPYTTGDIHWGSNDQEYTDADGITKTVYHRGHDNFLAALRYIKDTYPPGTIEKIFVTGQSAGSYGAIFNFPYVKEVYKDATVYCLGDAGNGVSPPAFTRDSIDNWNVAETLPGWISAIDVENFKQMTIGEIYKSIADHYSDSQIAQYTAKYDHNQRYFYYVMLEIDTPSLWDYMGGDGEFVPDEDSCDWTETMLSHIATAKAASNYRAYVAPGEVHTITTDEDMYDVVSDGVPFMTWLGQMLDFDPAWANVECNDADNGCEPPATEESPEGLVCPGE